MRSGITRRHALLKVFGASASLACLGQLVKAETSWPSAPIKIIVGGAAGSVPDSLARLAADALSKKLGQPVIIENRPGAGGILAMERLAASAPDGYTIGLGTVSQAVFNSYLYSKLPYNPRRDIVPVSKLVTSSFVLAANPALNLNNLADAIALSQKIPKKLLIGIPANGSPPHVAAILLLQKTRLQATFVPFRSGPDALTAAIRGDVQLLIDGPTLIAPQVNDRRLKALAVTGHTRQDALPGIPTLAELGFKNAECESWMGLFAPRGTSPEIIARLNHESRAILDNSEYVGRLKALSFVPQSGSTDEFSAFIGQEHRRWSGALRSAGLKLN
jgi:tripartite-type tricarboxylate transporter receptor subunit TctC